MALLDSLAVDHRWLNTSASRLSVLCGAPRRAANKQYRWIDPTSNPTNELTASRAVRFTQASTLFTLHYIYRPLHACELGLRSAATGSGCTSGVHQNTCSSIKQRLSTTPLCRRLHSTRISLALCAGQHWLMPPTGKFGSGTLLQKSERITPPLASLGLGYEPLGSAWFLHMHDVHLVCVS